MSLKNAKIFITGGAGLIGSHIAELALAQEAGEVIVLDDFSRGTRDNLAFAADDPRLKIIEGDIRDSKLLRDALRGTKYLFHQAALRITQCAEEPELAVNVLINGTLAVMQAAVEARVGKVVAASTASVYGLAESFPTRESHHPYNNRTLYGAAKCFNEGLLRSFNDMYGLDYVALRYFNVYGPRMDIFGVYTEVLVRWMERIEQGEPPLIFGDGEQTMDFVYVEDIARANIPAAQADATDEVFNVGSGTETSLNQLAAALLKVMNADLTPEKRAARKVNPVSRRLASCERAKEALGFRSQVSLEEGLARLVTWWKARRSAAARS